MKVITGEKYIISGRLFVACSSESLKENPVSIGETVVYDGKLCEIRGCMPPTPKVDKWAIWLDHSGKSG